MSSIERRMVAAYRAGQRAAREKPGSPNPHHGMSDDVGERVLSILWRKGYRRVVDERLPAAFPATRK